MFWEEKVLKYKKIMLMAIFFVSLLAVSAVSAADNSTGDIVGEEIREVDDSVILTSEIEENTIAAEESEDVLGNSPSSYDYSVTVRDASVKYGSSASINIEIDPATGYTNKYDFYLRVYDSNNHLKIEKNYYSTSDGYQITHTISKNQLAAGTYTVKAVNYDDNVVMDTAKLVIKKDSTHVKSSTISAKIGSRVTLKAYVYDSSNSRKNIAGTVKFKINGKTYSAKVKNGYAVVKNVILPLKSKTYKSTVKFSGNKNYKASSSKFNVKTKASNVVFLKKNHSIKIGKYVVKLSSSQYKSLVKAFKKGGAKSIKIVTKYNHPFKYSYLKTVKKYKTTKAVKTWYAGSYMPMINKMKSNGWTKISEYTYTKKNPQNKYGIGLSAYTYAVCKWAKVSYKTAYKTKYYPVNAKISLSKSSKIPAIKVYSHGKVLKSRSLAIV